MKREESNQITRDKILKAAIQEFGEKDYWVASTNTMCKNCNISKGIIFHHFKSKDELFLKCVEVTLKTLNTYIKTNYVKVEDNIEESVNNYFEVRRKFLIEYPTYGKIFNGATIKPPDHLKKEIQDLMVSLKQLNIKILTDLLKSESVKYDLTEEQVSQFILSYFEYILVMESDKTEEILQQQMMKVIKIIFWGVLN